MNRPSGRDKLLSNANFSGHMSVNSTPTHLTAANDKGGQMHLHATAELPQECLVVKDYE